MQCLACGADNKMLLMDVVQDDTMKVPVIQRQIYMCSACRHIARRLVFRRAKMPITHLPVIATPTRVVAPRAWGKAAETQIDLKESAAAAKTATWTKAVEKLPIGVDHVGQPTQSWENLAQDFEAFGGEIGSQVRQAGDVAARPRQRSNQPAADWVSRGREDNRDHRCRRLCRDRCLGSAGENDIDLEPDELGRDLGKALGASLPPAVSIATVRPSIQPSSCSRCTKASRHARWLVGVPPPR